MTLEAAVMSQLLLTKATNQKFTYLEIRRQLTCKYGKKYNAEFKEMDEISWKTVKNGEITSEQYITDLNGMLASYLESKPEFQEERKEFLKHKQPTEKPLEDACKQKILLNKIAKQIGSTPKDKENAKEAIRYHSYLLKFNKERESLSTARKENKFQKKE